MMITVAAGLVCGLRPLRVAGLLPRLTTPMKEAVKKLPGDCSQAAAATAAGAAAARILQQYQELSRAAAPC